MVEKKTKKLTEEQIFAIMCKRELERRHMISDIIYFFENYVYIENKDGKTPETRNILFKMFPEQKRVLQEIIDNSKNIIIKARQLGMTWLAIAYAVHESIGIEQFTVAILSQTEDYMYEAINRVEYILMRLPKWLIREYNKESSQNNSIYLYEKKSDEVTIYFPAREDGVRITSKISGYVSTEKSGRSITADLIILDEWAYHENAEAVFAGIGPTVNRPDSGKIIGISSNKRGSYFEDVVKDCRENGDMGFNLIFLGFFADPRRTKEFYEQTKKTFKNTWMQEYPETIDQALSAGELTAFPEFNADTHVCSPFEIPEHWTKWASCDNGYRDPFAWYKAAIDEDGIVYIYYEYTRERSSKDPLVHYSDQAKKFMADCTTDITERAKDEIESLHMGYETDGMHEYELEKLQYIIFGLDAFNRDTSKCTGRSLLDFYKEAGMTYPAERAVTDRALRKSTWHEYLKPFEESEVIEGRPKARVQIFSTCKYLIKYLPQLVIEKDNPNVVADNSKLDNCYDSAGYLLIGSPRNNSHRLTVEEAPIAKFKKERIKRLRKRHKNKGILN